MFNMRKIKIIISVALGCFLLMLSSCKSITLVNEVINRNITYDENISILDFEDTLVEATKIATESSVSVVTTSGNILFSTESFGSGTIIKREILSENKYEYYVLTNRHVVLTNGGNKKNVFVKFPNEEKINAEICVYDYAMDVAIIKFKSSKLINPAKVCLDNIDQGRFVVAVGSPYDINKYEQTVTIGNISHNNRVIEEQDTRGNKVNNIYIQHTASLNSGNSGGGLFNIKGELIGINSWKIVDQAVEGMNFSIPLSAVYPKYQQYFE